MKETLAAVPRTQEKEDRESQEDRGVGEVLFPKIDERGLPYTVDNHLCDGNRILKAIHDIAEVGASNAEAKEDWDSFDRFISIREFLRLYQAGNAALSKKIFEDLSRSKP